LATSDHPYDWLYLIGNRRLPLHLNSVKNQLEAVLKMFLCKPFCCRPEPPFFVALSASEGAPWGRRPERSEGCTAYARQDKVGGDLFEQHQNQLKFLDFDLFFF
jgi:hypothetical protein